MSHVYVKDVPYQTCLDFIVAGNALFYSRYYTA